MRAAYLAAIFAALLAGCSKPPPAGPPTLTKTALDANNRGVGQMGKFEYDAARAEFEAVVRAHPDSTDARVNLAIAIFNRQRSGDENAALAIVEDVLRAEPRHLRAHYVAGLIRMDQAALALAAAHFRAVADADRGDAYAAYFLGQTLAMQDDSAHALPYYRRAIAADPFLRSAYYATAQLLARGSDAAEARDLLARFDALAQNPRARLAEFKYTRMGPRAEAIVLPVAPAPAPRAARSGEIFAAPVTMPIAAGIRSRLSAPPADQPASITAADVDGDGRIDLFVADAFDAGDLHNALLFATPEGGYRLDRDHPLARVPGVRATAWGDVDNDGRIDAMLCRGDGDQWWRQLPDHRFVNATARSGITGRSPRSGARGTVDCALVDADHDGDLDFVAVRADGPSALWSNNLDGTFRDLSAKVGFDSAAPAGARGMLAADFDNDRDLDLALIGRNAPHAVFHNDRQWMWHRAAGFDAFAAAPIVAAVAGDVDGDGHVEIYTATANGAILRFAPDPKGVWMPAEILPADSAAAPVRAMQLALVDVDGSGTPDLVKTEADGWSAWDVRGARATLLFRARHAELRGWTPVLRQPSHGPSIVAVTSGGDLVVWDPGPGRSPFAAVALTGEQSAGNATRSNTSGIGARVAARIGARWSMLATNRDTSGPGQSLQPLAIGLGDAARVDFVRIDWSDGVMQTELAVGGEGVQRIAEIQRQLSSCPLVFAWNGREYAFVADALGAAALGYPISPGEVAPVRGNESVMLGLDALRARDGRYSIRIAEPMEEVAYLDAVALVAYDLPAGWQMVLDERMPDEGPAPTGAPRYFHREMHPSRVVDERGTDVTAALSDADLVAAPVPASDRRFIGRLAADHVLTIDFPSPIAIAGATPTLVIDGWVEVPYAQTSLAAWQAHADYRSPTLEAQDAHGRWRPVLAHFGYPAGTPRRMSVALPPTLPAGTKRLRLTTNEEIYWDRIAIAQVEPQERVRITRLALADAEVAFAGFMATSSGAQKEPRYDYAKRAPIADMHVPAGRYTAYGPARPLVADADAAFAILGPGDEIRLAFETIPDPQPGTVRHFVLEMRGFVRDMDLGTRDGDRAIAPPLPSEAPAAKRLADAYNTRIRPAE